MTSIGEGHLPLNLGVATVTPKLHNGLDMVLSVQSMQEQGYTVVFPPFGGMIAADSSNKIVLDVASPECRIEDFTAENLGHLQWQVRSVPAEVRPYVMPTGTPNQWRRASRSGSATPRQR